MGNLINFVRDKIYYLLIGTIVIIVLIIVVNACSASFSKKTYDSIEKDMVKAAKEYYSSREDKLPKEDNGTVKVNISTLVETELLYEVKDPKKESNLCTGYVEVTKVGDEYSYIPFLSCKGNYEPSYLTDKIKNSKLDEYGNGVYTLNGELVYRGKEVNNYVSFNDLVWRIVKVDSAGDIKLVLAERTQDSYPWDTAYNSDKEDSSGVTTNYLQTDIRKTLDKYYEDTFSAESKAKIVSKDICVGKYTKEDQFSTEKECSIKKENEKIGLLNASDFQNASLDSKCLNLSDYECGNYNYLSDLDFNTWLLNSSSQNTYKVFYLSGTIKETLASVNKKINPVVYLSNKTLVTSGKGTLEEPYILK